jgi:hypothetical protein
MNIRKARRLDMKAIKAATASKGSKGISAVVRRKKTSSGFGFSPEVKGLIRDFSYRLEVPPGKLEVAIAATRLGSERSNLLKFIVEMSQDKSREQLIEKAAKSFSEVRRRIASTDEDPLACVDEAAEMEILQSHIEAEIESEMRREKILAMCIPVEEAEGLAKRSRQRLEELRDKGRLIALRVRNRWMYPRWQFDPDFPGGVVPGLEEVLKHLQLSPSGAALWLTEPYEALGDRRPIDLLRAGKHERNEVIDLALQQGHMA